MQLGRWVERELQARQRPPLQVQAALVRDAVAAQPECAPLAANLATLLDAHAAAMETVAREADELATAREALDAARERSDRMRRAGWHYLNYAAAFQDLAVDIAAIYPVRSRGRTSDAEGDAALDAAGAEAVPEAGAKTP